MKTTSFDVKEQLAEPNYGSIVRYTFKDDPKREGLIIMVQTLLEAYPVAGEKIKARTTYGAANQELIKQKLDYFLTT